VSSWRHSPAPPRTTTTAPRAPGTTAWSGAAADNYHGAAGAWHHGLVLVALVVNVIAAGVEYRAIVRNGRLIDGVLEKIN
jgi:hypothetical protein